MSIEQQITAHYAKKDTSEVGVGSAHLHIGGEKATRYFLDKLGLKKGMRVLDIGCGVGGPAILAAEEYGCHVCGIDLTPEFITMGKENAAASAAQDLLDFRLANSDNLDFEGEEFDVVMMLHVGMNLPNKKEIYGECARVLKLGGMLALYDILAAQNIAEMLYPCPWAATIETSFMEDFFTVLGYLEDNGFTLEHREDRRGYAIAAITKMIEIQGDTLSPFRQIVIGNLLRNIEKGACAPFILIGNKA